jgi:hypothetical protein
MEQNNASCQRPPAWKQTITLALILGAAFISFSSSLKNGFVNWDDPEHFWENPEVRSLAPGHVARVFQGSGVNAYRPLTVLSFAVEYHFFKYNPFYYHLDNILPYLGVTALVFVFALQTGLALPAAALAALLFNIHPMRVESLWLGSRNAKTCSTPSFICRRYAAIGVICADVRPFFISRRSLRNFKYVVETDGPQFAGHIIFMRLVLSTEI